MEPVSLREALLEYGLHLADLQNDELQTAYLFMKTYIHLSVHDSFALAIARHRGWVLLTGDKSLIKAAKRENVECHGTLWIYDQFTLLGKITKEEKNKAMDALIEEVLAEKRRLPIDELRKRKEKNPSICVTELVQIAIRMRNFSAWRIPDALSA